MGETVSVGDAQVTEAHMRVARGLVGAEQTPVLDCWIALFQGALQSQRLRKEARVIHADDQLIWEISLV